MRVLVSHIDLDGYGCAIVAKAKNFADFYMHVDYNKVDEAIIKALDMGDEVFITDLSPNSQEVIDLLEKNKDRVKLYDHHKTAKETLADYSWATVDTSRCGTKLFAEEEELTEGYEDFIRIVNDYDLWIHDDPRSTDINMLLWLIRPGKFVNRFLENPSIELTEEEQIRLNAYKIKRQQYCDAVIAKKRIVADKQGRKVCVVLNEKYTSDIADQVLTADSSLDYMVLLDLTRGKASLRSKELDVSELAKVYGGGGHKFAAGFEMPADELSHRFLGRGRRRRGRK